MIVPIFCRFSVLLWYSKADALDTIVRLLRISMIILFRYRMIFFLLLLYVFFFFEIMTEKT